MPNKVGPVRDENDIVKLSKLSENLEGKGHLWFKPQNKKTDGCIARDGKKMRISSPEAEWGKVGKDFSLIENNVFIQHIQIMASPPSATRFCLPSTHPSPPHPSLSL